MLEATTLPTVPQPLPNHRAKFDQGPRNVRNVLTAFLASIIQLEQVLRQKNLKVTKADIVVSSYATST